MQNSPLQSGQAQPSHVHDPAGCPAIRFAAQQARLATVVAVFAQQVGVAAAAASDDCEATVFCAAQHEDRGAAVKRFVAARQPQLSHSHGSQVQNSPLQSGHLHPIQPQPLGSAVLRAAAVNVQARPMMAAVAAMKMEARFMVHSLMLETDGRQTAHCGCPDQQTIHTKNAVNENE